jgi:hypothetical protein
VSNLNAMVSPNGETTALTPSLLHRRRVKPFSMARTLSPDRLNGTERKRRKERGEGEK